MNLSSEDIDAVLAGAGDSFDNGAAQITCASGDGNNTHPVQDIKLTLVSKPKEQLDV